jgi:hypothetical protein
VARRDVAAGVMTISTEILPRRQPRRPKTLRQLPYTDAHRQWRRLAAAVLLTACTDAKAGDEAARAWLHSDQAHQWAGLVDLPAWPPNPEQLASRRKLTRRWHALEEA